MAYNTYVSPDSPTTMEFAQLVRDLCGFDDVDLFRFLMGKGQ